MKVDDVHCSEVREELSARLDDEDIGYLRDAVDEHLAGCAACRRYKSALMSVRRQIRVQPATVVPDLTQSILEKVHKPSRNVVVRPFLRTAVASALATALLAGLLALPGGRDRVDVASASEIVAEIRKAARHLTEYRATFDVHERNWHPEVEDRRFDVSVWYRAPEDLHVETRDRTDYPAKGTWTPSNATLITNRTKAYVERSLPCPPPTLSACSVPPEPVSRLTVNRQPLEGSAPSVTDIVLPLETLASSTGVEVVGAGESILDRRTIRVRLPFWQGHVLASAVQPGFSRPFDPTATMDLWLDSSSWFPLRFTVTEPDSSEPDLTATATSIGEAGVADADFEVDPNPDHVVDARFIDGNEPALQPSYRADLKRYRSGLTPDGHTISSFADGLSWLTVVTSTEESTPESLLYSDVVQLPKAGPVYYEPGSYQHARVVDIFDGSNHVRLESNLPRETLLEIADSVPVHGELIDEIQRGPIRITRAPPKRVLALSFFKRPQEIPAGYEPSNATITRSEGRISSAVLRYSDPENEYAGGGILITASPGERLLPASAEPFSQYDIGRDNARWSALRGELEWIDDGIYRSVRVADFRVDFAVAIAGSMR